MCDWYSLEQTRGVFLEQGEVLLLRFANDLEDYGKVEQMPVLEGKRMIIMISPKKGAGVSKAKKVASAAKAEEAAKDKEENN